MTVSIAMEKTHIQSTAAAVWNITHGFGRPPVVDVFVQLVGWNTPRKVLPEEVKIISATQVQITFAGIPTAGTAVLR